MTNTLHIYKRVSTQIQVDGTSLKTQEEIGKELALKLNMKYEIHDEGGRSSAKDDLSNRPVMSNLLTLMEKGLVKHLFVYNTDRLSRNHYTWYLIRQQMVKNGVTLYTPKGVHDTNDSMENMILGILSEISQYDNSIRTERSRLGKLEKIRMNFWRGGPPPFGFKLNKEDKGTRLIENIKESKWIKFIFQSYASGMSTREIKNSLEYAGVKTRRNNAIWSFGSIQKIIRNKIYIGYHQYVDKKTGEEIINFITPLISNHLFNKANNRRLNFLNRKGQFNRSKQSYLLRDLLVCQCGTPMGARVKEHKNERHYYCPLPERNFVKEQNRSCKMKKSLNIPIADKELWNVIFQIVKDSNNIKNQIKEKGMLGVGINSNELLLAKDKLEKKLSLVKDKIATLEESLISIESSHLLGEYQSEDIYLGIRSKLRSKYSKLQLEKEVKQFEVERLTNHEDWLDWLDELSNSISSTSNDSNSSTQINKKKFLHSILDSIEVSYLKEKELHHLKMNFRFPIFRNVGSLVSEFTRGRVSQTKSARNNSYQTTPLENHSTVTDFAKFLG